jgi:PAS domain-containing protein
MECSWLARYIRPDDQPVVMDAIHAAIETKSVFELGHRVFRPDGMLGWRHSRAVPLLDDGGEILEWAGAASDVTESRESERPRPASS